MMKLFAVWNTSSNWLVVAPDEETAINYSYQYTLTREKKNLNVNDCTFWYEKDGINEILEGKRIGILMKVKIDEPPGFKLVFTRSHEWIPEKRNWRGAPPVT